MKRPIDTKAGLAGGGAGTPFDPSMGKKLRQTNLLDTPIAGLASAMADTPESGPNCLPMEGPSTTERLLAGFTLDTPVAGVTGVTVLTPCLGKALQPGPSPTKCQPPSPQLDPSQFVTPEIDAAACQQQLEPHNHEQLPHNQPPPPHNQQLALQFRLDLQVSTSLQSLASGSDVFVLEEQPEPAPSCLAPGPSRLSSGRAGHAGDDDFVLSISQSYRRQLDSPEGPSFQTPTQFLHAIQEPAINLSQHSGQQPSGSCGALCEDADGCGFAGLSALLPGYAAGAVGGAAGVNALAPEETRTPELEPVCVSSSQQAEESTATECGEGECEAATFRPLAPIFRVRSQRKFVILVRHGESTYNQLDAEGRSWNDPSVYDAALTKLGSRQARELREELRRVIAKHEKHGDALWVTSPLTRAIDTMLLACPYQERLDALAKQPLGDASNGASSSSGDPVKPLNVVVLSTITEHCATSGDVGRTRSNLQAAFPQLAAAEWDVPVEEWWYNPDPDTKPNCAQRKVLGKREPKVEMQRRVAEFRRWLNQRPERLVVAFGHSTFWKAFSNAKSPLKNCGILAQYW